MKELYKKVSLFHKITKQHNGFNIDNNKKYFLSTKSELFLKDHIQVHLNKLECRGKVHLFQ